MTDHEGISSIGVQFSPSLVGNGDVVEDVAALKLDFGNANELLVLDEACERVLGDTRKQFFEVR